jgi:hypothetical protein
MGFAVIAAVVSIGTAIYSVAEGQKAADRQKKAARAAQRERESAAQKQERLESIQARRDRLQAIRESRIKRASLVAQGEGMGVSGSSGVSGGISSLGSQLGSNIAFSETTAAFGQSIGQNMLQASRIETQSAIDMAQSQADINMVNTIGSIASKGLSNVASTLNPNPGLDAFKNSSGGYTSFASQLPSTSQTPVDGWFK